MITYVAVVDKVLSSRYVRSLEELHLACRV